MPASEQARVVYIIFSEPWELFLKKQGAPDAEIYSRNRPVLIRSDNESLTYLQKSIRSFLEHNAAHCCELEILLVELAEGDSEDLFLALKDIAGDEKSEKVDIRITKFQQAKIAHLIDAELRSNSAHKSPNKIHEFILFETMLGCADRYLYISDIDTLYFKDGFIPWCTSLLSDEQKAICGFVERADGKSVYCPDRMHTVSLFIDTLRIRSLVDFAVEKDRIFDFDAKVSELKDRREKNYFLTARRSDTLSFLTSTLRHNFEMDLVAAFNDFSRLFFEDDLLVMGNEYLAHGKYLYAPIQEIMMKHYLGEQDILAKLSGVFNGINSNPVS